MAIRKELRAVGYTSLASLVIWLALDRVPGVGPFTDETFALDTLFVVLYISVVTGIVLGYPLLLSRRGEAAAAAAGSDTLRSTFAGATAPTSQREVLRRALRVAAVFDAFEAFLAREFASENLLFWEEVELFRDAHAARGSDVAAPDAGLVLDAARIYDRFVADNAPCQINLPHAIVRRLAAILGREARGSRASRGLAQVVPEPQPRPHQGAVNDDEAAAPRAPRDARLFDEAQQAIEQLLADDPFRRFRATPRFAELAIAAARERAGAALLADLEE